MADRPAGAVMTQDQFLAWVERQPVRYEFDGCRPVRKDPPPTTPDQLSQGSQAEHDRITANILQALASRLADTPGIAVGADLGIETVNRAVRYPDAVVTRAPSPDSGRVMPEPVVVFEVAGDTSRHADLFTKFREYHAVPAIQLYVVFFPGVVGALLYRRAAGPGVWTVVALLDDQVVALPEIGVTIPLSEIFRDVSCRL